MKLKWDDKNNKFVCGWCSETADNMVMIIPYKFRINHMQDDEEKSEYELYLDDLCPAFMLCKCGAMYTEEAFEVKTEEDFTYMIIRK